MQKERFPPPNSSGCSHSPLYSMYLSLSDLPSGRGLTFRPSGHRGGPLLFWRQAESWLRPGLTPAPERLHTIARQRRGFARQAVHRVQRQLPPFGGLGWRGRERRWRIVTGAGAGRRGVHGARRCRRERANGARRPRGASHPAGIRGQPAGGRPGVGAGQRGECACVATPTSMSSR